MPTRVPARLSKALVAGAFAAGAAIVVAGTVPLDGSAPRPAVAHAQAPTAQVIGSIGAGENADLAWTIDEVTVVPDPEPVALQQMASAARRTTETPAKAQAPTKSEPAAPSSPVIDAPGNAAALCAQINRARTQNGLAALTSCAWSGARQAHTDSMAAAGTIWHESAPEIVGMAGTVSQMMWADGGYGFVSSTSHRAVILTPDYTAAKVGCTTSGPYTYCAVVFG